MHLTHIHTTDQKSMVFYTSLPPPELIPRLGHSQKVTKGDLAKCQKKNFFEAAFGPHIRQMRQGCASYSYTPRQSKKYGGCQTFGCARAQTPTQAHLSGTLPTRSDFFFFGRTFAPGIHQTGQDGASLSCSHRTSQTSGLLQKLGCQPAGEKKKNSEFRTFLGHCGTWHG